MAETSTDVSSLARAASASSRSFGLVAAFALSAAACSTSPTTIAERDPVLGVKPSPRVVAAGKPVPKGGGVYRVGQPYKVASDTYTPMAYTGYSATGTASWYGDAFHGRLTANGEVYDRNSLSAAHPTLPLPSYVRVTNMSNGRSVVVRVNDRGPFSRRRLIDVSARTAELLDFRRAGTARVKIDYVGLASLKGSDDRKLLATFATGGKIGPSPEEFRLASLAPPPPAPPRPHGEVPPPPPAHAASADTPSAEPVTAAPTETRGAPSPTYVAQRVTAGWSGMPAAPVPLRAAPASAPPTTLALTPPY